MFHSKKVIVVCVFLMQLTLSYAQQNLTSTPAHENKIITMGIYENILYTLDANGLLKQTNLTSKEKDYFIPIRQEIVSSYFYYPYIVMIDIENKIHVYNLTQKNIEYSGLFLNTGNKGYSNFSSDYSIFAFTSVDGILLLDTHTWENISVLPYRKTAPDFLVISQNNKNLMTYNSIEGIHYEEINTKKILKEVDSSSNATSLILNNTKRFGVGFSSRDFSSIDMINGQIIDSILFANPIIDVFPSTSFNAEYKEINIIIINNGTSNSIKSIRFNNDGTIMENDNININIERTPSYIVSNEQYMFLGFHNGEIWSYNLTNSNLNKQIISDDHTLAIYDAMYTNEHILLSTTDGILNIPATIQNAKINIETNSIQLSAQKLENPSFVSSTNNNFHILSTSAPYNHKIPRLLANAKKIISSYIPPQEVLSLVHESLLYPFNINDFTIDAPQLLHENITQIKLISDDIVSYSSANSQIYITTASNNTITIPLVSSRFIYEVSFDNKIQKKIIWTNSPLLATASTNATVTNNVIYSYILDETISPLYNPIQLNFVNKEIYSFQVLNTEPLSLVISTIDNDKEHTKIYLVNMGSPHTNFSDTNSPDSYSPDSNSPNTNTGLSPSIYPDTINLLSIIPSKYILNIISFDNNNKLLLIEDAHITVLTLDSNNNQLASKYSVNLPEKFGILVNVNITEINQGFALTLVDKNKTVMIYYLNDTTKLSHLRSFNILTPNYEFISLQ